MDYEKVFKNKFEIQLGQHYKCRDGSIIKAKLIAHSTIEEDVDYVVYSKDGEIFATNYDEFFEIERKDYTGKVDLTSNIVDDLSYKILGMIVDIRQLVNLITIDLYDGQNLLTLNLSKELSVAIINKDVEIYPEQFVEIVGFNDLNNSPNKQLLYICELSHELVK